MIIIYIVFFFKFFFAGNIVDDIQKAGFVISAIKQFQVDPVNAAEFLEVYKGVVANYGVGFN